MTAHRLKVLRDAIGQTPDHRSLSGVHRVINRSGESLDPRIRADMEARFGHCFDAVRIHTDEMAAQSTKSLSATAYTLGQHIVFGHNRYRPQSTEGRRLIAHELAHTVQQPNTPSYPTRVSQSQDTAEHEARQASADVLGSRPPRLGRQPAMVMRDDDKGSMAGFAREARGELRRFFEYQSRFKDLNGREIRNLLRVLEGDRDGGTLQGLIDNFDAATGVNRPRLRVALHAVARKATTTRDEFARAFSEELDGLPADQRRAVLDYVGAPASKAETRPAGVAPAAQGPFTTKPYSMSTAETTLVRGRKEEKKGGKVVTKGRAEIKESPQHFTSEILELAKVDRAWFQNFTSIPFLGFTVSDVHTELATHLKAVEQKFVEKYGGDQKDPVVAGKALGIKQNIGGGRHAPTGTAVSMHLFGLAIDVNYNTNPWIVEDPEGQSGKAENAILARATLLVDGKETKFIQNMSYDEIAALNQSIKTYFSYIDDRAALEAKLQGGTGVWAGKSVDDAAKQVRADFDKLAVYWERSDPKQKDVLKAGGFLDLQKAFVEGMGLDWGGKYGDMMHFDMRNKGSGVKIEAARLEYKRQKVQEAETKYSEEHGE